MKKVLFLVLPTLLIIAGIGSYFYYQKIHSPEYSLLQVQQAVSNHDISTFEKHVDIDGILIRMLTDLPSVMTEKPQSGSIGFMPEEAVSLIKSLMEKQFKEAIQQTLRETTRSFIERGYFDKQLTEKGSISKLLKVIPLDSLEVLSVGNIQKEGKICYVPLNIFVEKYDGQTTAKFMLRDKGGYWQVAEVSNLPELINQLKQIQATYPYRNLFATSTFLAQSIKDEETRLNSLSEIATRSNADNANTLASEIIILADTIKNERQKEWILGKIPRILIRANNSEKAINWASTIKKQDLKDKIFYEIITNLAENGEVEKAINITKSFIANTEIKREIKEDMEGRVLFFATSRLVEDGEVEKAINITSTASIKSNPMKIAILSTIATGLKKKGENERANTFFSEAITIAESIINQNEKAGAFAFIARDFAEAGDFERAINITESMIDGEDRSKYRAYSDIATALTKAGNVDRAIKLIESVNFPNKEDRYNAVRGIVFQLARDGKGKDTINLAKTLEDRPIHDQLTFPCWLGRILADAGDIEHAKVLLEEAVKIVEATENDRDKALWYGRLGAGFAKAGNIDRASNFFVKAINITKSTNNDIDKGMILKKIATNLNECSVKNKENEGKIANAVMTAYKGPAI